jgi:hypothetical protein
MRRSLVIAAICTVGITPAVAGAPSESNFQALWNKYAVGFGEKPKMGCVCFDGVNNFRLGTVVAVSSGLAGCYMPSFDKSGVLISQDACNGQFAPLAR